MEGRHRQSPKRCTGDDGTALVEFAMVLVPLSLMVFGIIVYGYLMSFRQNMTAAAAEGARAGAVVPADGPNVYTTAISRATQATNKALGSFGQSCDGAKMTCDIHVNSAGTGDCLNSSVPCITVKVTYHYSSYKLLPDIPLVSAALPNDFVSSSSAQLNT